jgi:hypothetical protein
MERKTLDSCGRKRKDLDLAGKAEVGFFTTVENNLPLSPRGKQVSEAKWNGLVMFNPVKKQQSIRKQPKSNS